jgi:hypothetical protein
MSSSIILKIDLGQQSNVFNCDDKTITAKNTTDVGLIVNRYDINSPIYLARKPDNNIINVKLFDNDTGLLTAIKYDYVIQLFLEKISI